LKSEFSQDGILYPLIEKRHLKISNFLVKKDLKSELEQYN